MCNLKQDNDITKELIEEKKLNWCRLMFAIYIKSSDGGFRAVSPATYSELIEQSMTMEIVYVLIDRRLCFHIIARTSQIPSFEDVFPNTFCERGGQIILIKLNEVVKKEGVS